MKYRTSVDDPVAEEIREARRELRMTQTAFGEAVGVSKTTITMWECGHTPPRLTHLLLVRSLLSLSRIKLGLELQRVHRCFCFDAGYEAGVASANTATLETA